MTRRLCAGPKILFTQLILFQSFAACSIISVGLLEPVAESVSERGKGNSAITRKLGKKLLKDDHREHVYIAPSGVQKERMQPQDLFVMTLADRTLLRKPLSLKPSACTPLFYNAYTMRDAGACIHTHSQNAVMATLLYPGSTFEISHQEMIKGIRRGTSKTNLRYFDKLVVPIVENTPEEEDLTERMAKVCTNIRRVTNVQ